MSIKHEVRRLFWRLGYDISRFEPISHPLARRKRIFENYGIDTVFDIGANSGGFARQIRQDLGYSRRILSFEPLSDAFRILEANSKNDPNWDVFNLAIGDADEKREMNIAENSLSSSLLAMLPSHLESEPGSKFVGKEMVEVRRLDSIYADLSASAKNVFLKIDTQGYEKNVIVGAENSLEHIDTVQLEMSLIPLYRGELLFHEMCVLMANNGYSLVAIEPVFSDRSSGQLLQADGIFHRFNS